LSAWCRSPTSIFLMVPHKPLVDNWSLPPLSLNLCVLTFEPLWQHQVDALLVPLLRNEMSMISLEEEALMDEQR
jgi:hypothetical protein